jgi:hypothetical protein
VCFQDDASLLAGTPDMCLPEARSVYDCATACPPLGDDAPPGELSETLAHLGSFFCTYPTPHRTGAPKQVCEYSLVCRYVVVHVCVRLMCTQDNGHLVGVSPPGPDAACAPLSRRVCSSAPPRAREDDQTWARWNMPARRAPRDMF